MDYGKALSLYFFIDIMNLIEFIRFYCPVNLLLHGIINNFSRLLKKYKNNSNWSKEYEEWIMEKLSLCIVLLI
jgi:hypothetical protein